MIHVSKMNGQGFVLNCDMIKSIEATPDTLITLVSNEKIRVRESVAEVVKRAKEFRREIQNPFTSESESN